MTGISPNCFGPPTWTLLHMLSFNYPEKISESVEDFDLRNNMYNFFELLGYILPCQQCRENYKKKFYNLDLMASLDTREDFIKWVYNLHDLVNQHLGKKSPSLESVKETYQKLVKNSCLNSCTNNDIYCKVELIGTNGDQIEKYTNSTFNEGKINNVLLILLIITIIIIIILLIYIYYSIIKNNKFQNYRRSIL